MGSIDCDTDGWALVGRMGSEGSGQKGPEKKVTAKLMFEQPNGRLSCLSRSGNIVHDAMGCRVRGRTRLCRLTGEASV